jgi:hypothetical protein
MEAQPGPLCIEITKMCEFKNSMPPRKRKSWEWSPSWIQPLLDPSAKDSQCRLCITFHIRVGGSMKHKTMLEEQKHT